MYVHIFKENPNHDKAGRFAPKGTGSRGALGKSSSGSTKTTAHADSIPRTATQEKAHQKALVSENWHTKTMASFKDKSNDSLKYIQQDAATAAKANPTGKKAGQYTDEVHYTSMELRAREKHFSKPVKKMNIRADLGLPSRS